MSQHSILQDSMIHPNINANKGNSMLSPKVNRKLELLRRAREARELQESLLTSEVDDNIEDYAGEVLEGKRQVKEIPPSLSNKDIIPVKGTKTYSAALEHAIELLGKRVPASQVCTVCAISPSYLHEMMQDEHFMGRIVSIQTKKLDLQTKRDEHYDRIEDKLLERLEAQIPALMSAKDTANVLKIVNQAVRRGAGEVQGDIISVNNVVELTLPPHLLDLFTKQHEVTLNERNEVTKVAGTTLGRMDSTKLLNYAEAGQLIEDAEFSVKENQIVEDKEDNFEEMDSDELRKLL